MSRRVFACGIALIVSVSAAVGLHSAQTPAKADYASTFAVDKTKLSDAGIGRYWILEPGYTLHLQDGKNTLVVSVLAETKVVDGVKTRVVEERETANGQLAEVSRNYFAIDRTTGDVYYFGEDVDEYKGGKVSGHEGSWRSGVNGARFGLIIPGAPKAGFRYYQEQAPKVAMDRAEVVSVTEDVKVPAGVYKNCLRTRETSAIEGGSEDKFYAPGVGLVRDAGFALVKIEKGTS